MIIKKFKFYVAVIVIGFSSWSYAVPITITGGSTESGPNVVSLPSGAEGVYRNVYEFYDTYINDRGWPEEGLITTTFQSVEVGNDSVVIEALAEASAYFDSSYNLREGVGFEVRGSIDFDVLETGEFEFNWLDPWTNFHDGYTDYDNYSTLTITDSEANALLTCQNSGEDGTCNNGLTRGALTLAAGSYDIFYELDIYHIGTGHYTDTELNFSLQSTEVPVPGAALFFLSGLVSVGGMVLARRQLMV